MSDSSSKTGLLPRALAGAAAGALAAAVVATAEIVLRPGTGSPLSTPLRDLSAIGLGGAAAGLGLGALRAVPGLRALAPFGIVLGTTAALHGWLGRISGSGVLDHGPAAEAARGALWLLAGAALGQLLGVTLRRLPRPSPRPLRDAAVVAAVALPSLWPAGRPGAALDAPNVLLLTIDTLRADRIGAWGEPRPLTPNLDRLARRGTLFSAAVTPLPRTLPALASVMTGAPPHAHGVRDNFHYTLGDGARTLAEDLGSRGWATAAVNSNPVLSHDSGIFQGFASANDRGDDWSRLGIVRGIERIRTLVAMRRGDRDRVTSDLAAGWLDRRPRGRPFFLWVHWLAPHMPYEPAYPFDRILDPDYRGDYRYAIDYGRVSKGDMTYRNPLTPREREHAVALYDGEVATSDRAVGRLLRRMELRGDLDDTIVVLLSDHGESLVEHGYFFNHGDFVYGPATDVPLVVGGPGVPAGRVDATPTSLVEVLPRIVARLTGAPERAAPGTLFGESGFCRFPQLNERLGWQLPPEIAQSPELVPDWRERWAAQANRAKQRYALSGEWKLVRSPHETGDRDELFDLQSDPGETHDVAPDHPDRATDLAGRLDAWVAEGDAAEPTAGERSLDDETRRQMEAIGYLGD